jgi:SET domain-containing protein
MITVGNTNGKGRGVFAQKPFTKGEIIERTPVIAIPKEEVELIDKTVLFNYYYDWNDGQIAVVLGLGSLYNHSYHPNALYARKIEERIMEYTAYQDIAVGEEITINYNYSVVSDRTPLWFDVLE